jgi:hypothetical protein
VIQISKIQISQNATFKHIRKAVVCTKQNFVIEDYGNPRFVVNPKIEVNS